MQTRSAPATRSPRHAPSARQNAPRRMTLGAVRSGIRPAPDRILVVGTEGVGKSTFAANAPRPIFIAAEDGIRHLDVASFPEPETFQDVLDAVAELTEVEHDFKTLVIDTLDWIEPLVWRAVCERAGWFDAAGNPDIEKPGYGKGYVAATEDWRRLLAALDRLRNTRQMEVILLAHAAIKAFHNPAGGDYSRYECKLAKGAAALVKEWCDSNLFAVHEEFVTEAKGIARAKGVSTGRRVVKTERTAAWDAKTRHALSPELPLDYAEYAAARSAGRPATPEQLRDEIVAITAALAPSPEAEAAIGAKLAACGDSVRDLARLLNVLRERLASVEATKTRDVPGDQEN